VRLPRPIETVIWDFNGTLLDDIDLVVHTANKQLARRGLAPMTIEAFRDAFGFPIEDYYRRIGVDFASESMAELAADFFGDYQPELVHCALGDGVLDALHLLSSSGVRQFVLSAMEEGMLNRTLEALGIRDRFVAAYGLAHLEADSKVSRGRDLVRDHAIEAETALMIGDTDHDAEVAASLGVACVLTPRGHQSRAKLEATGCPVRDSLSGIMEALVASQDR
jgi:phosphoglycolate phosphatase